MYKKPVWDDFNFVTQWVILLEDAIRWVHCGQKGMDMVSNNTQAVVFKRCSVGTKVTKVCQENIPHTITPPPSPAWTADSRQDWTHTFMLFMLNPRLIRSCNPFPKCEHFIKMYSPSSHPRSKWVCFFIGIDLETFNITSLAHQWILCSEWAPSDITFTFTFSRRFYPKRLTVHSGYTFFFISMCVPWELNPQPFALLTQCSTTEPQDIKNLNIK